MELDAANGLFEEIKNDYSGHMKKIMNMYDERTSDNCEVRLNSYLTKARPRENQRNTLIEEIINEATGSKIQLNLLLERLGGIKKKRGEEGGLTSRFPAEALLRQVQTEINKFNFINGLGDCHSKAYHPNKSAVRQMKAEARDLFQSASLLVSKDEIAVDTPSARKREKQARYEQRKNTLGGKKKSKKSKTRKHKK